MKTWQLIWAPDGRLIATVRALTAEDAVSKTPMPWAEHKGVVYAQEVRV